MLNSSEALGPNDFANRGEELKKIAHLLRSEQTSRPRVEVWHASPATGFSTFLRYSATLGSKTSRAIYVDCAASTPNSIFSQIIVALFNAHKGLWRKLDAYIAKRSGTGASREVAVHALAGLPWVGPALAKAGDHLTPRLELSHYPSAVAEVVCEFLVTLSDEEDIAILFDNVQDIEDWSLDLLRTTVGRPYKHLCYLFGVVQRPHTPPASTEQLLNKTLGGFYTPRQEDFPKPDESFIKDLARIYDVPLTGSLADAIATASEGNIYRILRTLDELSKMRTAPAEPLPPLQKKMLHFLLVASQALRLSDLVTLTALSPTVYMDSSDELHSGVEDLVQRRIVTAQKLPDGDHLLELASTSAPILRRDTSEVEDLSAASELYEHFMRANRQSSRHSQAEVVPILYRLSKKVDSDSTPEHIRSLIRLSLQMGSLGPARRFIDLATEARDLQSYTYQDFIVRASFLLSIRAYKQALELITSPSSPGWMEQRPTQILQAIALNRSREHHHAEQLMKGLLESPTSPEETSLLASFLIGGYLHQDQVSKAQQAFDTYREAASGAGNYGYFLRNAASAFSPPAATELLQRAVRMFDETHDLFGWATSLSNLAVNQARLGHLKTALEGAETALDVLEGFGIYHLHIVLNNVACIKLLLGQIGEAQSTLVRARSLARTNMPRILQTINIAGAHAMMGDPVQAAACMQDLLPEVQKHPVNRVRQLYFLNAAAIEICTQETPSSPASLLSGARRYPDRYNPDGSLRKAQALARLADQPLGVRQKKLRQFFSECFLAYWYQNPLEAVPADILTLEAPGENSLH